MTKIKICGITNKIDALAASELSGRYAGVCILQEIEAICYACHGGGYYK